MTDEALKYLSDIRHAISLIDSFVADMPNYDAYVSDLKTQSAVERQLAIIGEAANKFEALNPDRPLSHSRKIVGFRNRLIHAYDAMDTTIVWVVIKRHLSPLKVEVDALMNS